MGRAGRQSIVQIDKIRYQRCDRLLNQLLFLCSRATHEIGQIVICGIQCLKNISKIIECSFKLPRLDPHFVFQPGQLTEQGHLINELLLRFIRCKLGVQVGSKPLYEFFFIFFVHSVSLSPCNRSSDS